MNDFDIEIEEQDETSASGLVRTPRSSISFTATIDDSFDIEIHIDDSYEADFGLRGIEDIKESITEAIRENTIYNVPRTRVLARRKKR